MGFNPKRVSNASFGNIRVMSKQAEADFFHDIAPMVLKLVASFNGKAKVHTIKQIAGDYATEVDIETEKLIVSEIKKRFPSDSILAEENHSGTIIGSERVWII